MITVRFDTPSSGLKARQDGGLVGKSDHLGQHRFAGIGLADQMAQFADLDRRHVRFDQRAEHLRNLAVAGEARWPADLPSTAEPGCGYRPAWPRSTLAARLSSSPFHLDLVFTLEPELIAIDRGEPHALVFIADIQAVAVLGHDARIGP